ncbi:hypothetical protein KR093_000435, partial [Drosophila rubida]
ERRQPKRLPYFADEGRERDRVRNLRKRMRYTPTTPPRLPRHERQRSRSRSRSASADKSRYRGRRRRSRSYDRRRSRSGSHNNVSSSSSSLRRRRSRHHSRSRSRSRSRSPRIITVPVPVPAADYNYAYGWSHHPPRQHYSPMYPPMLQFGMNPRAPRPYFTPYPQQFPPFRYRSGPFVARPRFGYIRDVRKPPN